MHRFYSKNPEESRPIAEEGQGGPESTKSWPGSNVYPAILNIGLGGIHIY